MYSSSEMNNGFRPSIREGFQNDSSCSSAIARSGLQTWLPRGVLFDGTGAEQRLALVHGPRPQPLPGPRGRVPEPPAAGQEAPLAAGTLRRARWGPEPDGRRRRLGALPGATVLGHGEQWPFLSIDKQRTIEDNF